MVNILLIEDDDDDFILIRKMLSQVSSTEYRLDRVSTYEEALAAMGRDDHDVYLLDYFLGPRTGLELLREMNETAFASPVILLTGTTASDVDTEVLKAGASDYLVKGQLTAELLERSIRYAMERKRLERQLRESQKMEAIGTLAGGIAHDFNNMLAVILGNAELALDDIDDDGVRHNIEQILKASKRARDLIKQILTFSRRDEYRRKPFKAIPLVKETYSLLRGAIPSNIEMGLDIQTESDTVRGDPSQFQQILLNLTTNAHQAMREHGGFIKIILSDITVRKNGPKPDGEIAPGRYLKLNVEDTGPGMSDKVRRRIFEPFFTTKEAGQGTGMGLPVVYGIVKSHNGAITVHTVPGKGTAFSVYLPSKNSHTGEADEKETEVAGGNERILFIDDEIGVAEAGSLMLKGLGYDVTTVTSGAEAIEIFVRNPRLFDLVITDQTMPGLTGIAVAEQMLKARKDIPIILLTGYSETVSPERAVSAGIADFILKPVVRGEMAQAIRRVLNKRERERRKRP